MNKVGLRVIAIILISIVLGFFGLIIGALIGGNFATGFSFNGVQGYEATGQVGLIIGTAIGIIIGWLVLRKKIK
jgi:hypothetical protein